MKKTVTIFALVASVLVIVFLASNALGERETTKEPIDFMQQIDFMQMEAVVKEALQIYPVLDIQIERENHAGQDSFFTSLIHADKIAFREMVEQRLLGNPHSLSAIDQYAKERAHILRESYKYANEKYGISVSEEEVTDYIHNKVAPHEFEMQTEYARSLGLSVDELNHQFDIDLYAMDVFWGKLMHELTSRYPQTEVEILKETFYNSIK